MTEKHTRTCTGVWIPVEILDDKQLSGFDKLLLAEIDALRGEDDEGCFASDAYLANLVGLKPNGVRKAIAKLKQFRLIKTVRFNGRQRWLKVNWPLIKKGEQLAPTGASRKRPEERAARSPRSEPYREEKSGDNLVLTADAEPEPNKARPQSEQDVTKFCREIGLSEEDGRYYWNKWLGNGFTNNRAAMKDWRATIRAHKHAGYCPSQKNGGGQRRPKTEPINYDEGTALG